MGFRLLNQKNYNMKHYNMDNQAQYLNVIAHHALSAWTFKDETPEVMKQSAQHQAKYNLGNRISLLAPAPYRAGFLSVLIFVFYPGRRRGARQVSTCRPVSDSEERKRPGCGGE